MHQRDMLYECGVIFHISMGIKGEPAAHSLITPITQTTRHYAAIHNANGTTVGMSIAMLHWGE